MVHVVDPDRMEYVVGFHRARQPPKALLEQGDLFVQGGEKLLVSGPARSPPAASFTTFTLRHFPKVGKKVMNVKGEIRR